MIDPHLDAEYNNRARVPEHPEIIAGWARDAAAYRIAIGERCVMDVPYGEAPRQRMDLFLPQGGAAKAVTLFLHGGYWQALGKSSFSHMAQGVNAHDTLMAVAGYTLAPEASVAAIIAETRMAVRALVGRFGKPVTVVGHSAGGHLAACLAATDWASEWPGRPFDPVPAALPISGLFDLTRLVPTHVNDKLGLDDAAAEAVSPLRWTAHVRRKRLVAVVGGAESEEYLRQTRLLAERWREAGAATSHVEIAGANHFTVIAPLTDPASDLTRGLLALATS